MKAAADFVDFLVKFASCMKLGHDNLHSGFVVFWMDVHRDSPSVVSYCYESVIVYYDRNLVAEASQCLVNGIVNSLIDEMMQALYISCSDVHCLPFSDSA